MKTMIYRCDRCKQILSDGLENETEHIHTNGRIELVFKKSNRQWMGLKIVDGDEHQFCFECWKTIINESYTKFKQTKLGPEGKNGPSGCPTGEQGEEG